MSNFSLESISSSKIGPRAGLLSLPNGHVPTPVFMPVGTQATVKGTLPRDIKDVVRAPIILGNTYHLNLRQGRCSQTGGRIIRFYELGRTCTYGQWRFQVFSLSKLRKISDEGVSFRSHLDGREIFLGPKEAVSIQDGLRSDIAMCLDVCPAAEDSRENVESAVNRTTLWGKACQEAWATYTGPEEGRNLFGIVQGGRFDDLRKKSAEELVALDFPGYAVGGVSVGETEEEMLQQVQWTTAVLPVEKPRYVMGVGTPTQLLKMVGMGADMFDCVMPSRAARHGMAYTANGTLNLRNERFKKDYSPLDETSDCYASLEFSKSYIRHLIQAKESLAGTILTLHNLRFFVSLMEQAREHILGGTSSNGPSNGFRGMKQGVNLD